MKVPIDLGVLPGAPQNTIPSRGGGLVNVPCTGSFSRLLIIWGWGTLVILRGITDRSKILHPRVPSILRRRDRVRYLEKWADYLD